MSRGYNKLGPLRAIIRYEPFTKKHRRSALTDRIRRIGRPLEYVLHLDCGHKILSSGNKKQSIHCGLCWREQFLKDNL